MVVNNVGFNVGNTMPETIPQSSPVLIGGLFLYIYIYIYKPFPVMGALGHGFTRMIGGLPAIAS